MEQLLTSNIAAIVMAGGFLWYLTRKDKLNKETSDGFTKVIENHLHTALNVQKETNKVSKELVRELQKNTDVIQALDKRINGK